MAKRVRWKVKQRRLELAAKLGRDVTLQEVSNATGITVSRLSTIENNKSKGVEFGTLERLAEFYQLTNIADLLAIEDITRATALAARA